MWTMAIIAMFALLTIGMIALVLGIGKGSDICYGLAKVAFLACVWVMAMIVSYVFVVFMRWLAGRMG